MSAHTFSYGATAPQLLDEALIACHDCDLLQRERTLLPGETSRCIRCGAEMHRSHADSLDRTLACASGALILFVLANVFPIVGLKAGGDVVKTTLFGAVRALYDQDMWLVAGIVFLTAMLTPLAQLLALIYLLLPLKFDHLPPKAAMVFRTLNLSRAWSMVEVFMLGILVALVKLAHIAHVVPGMALWSFGGLILLLTAATSSFEPQAFWARLRAIR